MLNRPYRVKESRTVDVAGTSYSEGQIVFLGASEAYYHRESIEPAFDVPGDDYPPYEEFLRVSRIEDLEAVWFGEEYEPLPILAVFPSPTTVVCKAPHYLPNGSRVNVRFSSPTLAGNFQTIATVVGVDSFTVPESFTLPADFDVAEVGVPIDFTGSTFSGGIFNYGVISIPYTLVGAARTVAGSNRIVFSSDSAESLGQIRVNDSVRITGGVAALTKITGKSEITRTRLGQYEIAVLLEANASATIQTDQIFAERPTVSDIAGSLAVPFAFSGNSQYGQIIARIQSTALSSLPYGVYPFQVLQTTGTVDKLLIAGIVEVF